MEGHVGPRERERGDGERGGALAFSLGLPLVLMTALPADHPERQALPAPVLTKPFSAADLAAALASAIHD